LGPRFPERSRAETRSLPGPYGPVTCPELRKSNSVLEIIPSDNSSPTTTRLGVISFPHTQWESPF
jgi:hypothetical protein